MNNKLNNMFAQMVKSIQVEFENNLKTLIAQLKESFKIRPEVAEGIRIFLKALENWPEWQKEYWLKAAEMGWYFNWATPASSCLEATNLGRKNLDEFMVWHLENDWKKITERIIELCPERAEILKEAFCLHEEGRYIGSIPVLFAQTDGICAENLGAFLYSEHPRRAEQIENALTENRDKSLNLFLDILKIKNQYSKGISRCSPHHKENGPNRNGVLHGSRKHLDYGTKINSLKCFSLLAYVVFILVENKEKLHNHAAARDGAKKKRHP